MSGLNSPVWINCIQAEHLKRKSWIGRLRLQGPCWVLRSSRHAQPDRRHTAKLIYQSPFIRRAHCEQAWPSCSLRERCETRRNALKMEMSVCGLYCRGLWDFQPIYSVTSQREPGGIWTLSDSMLTNGCVISLLPLPLTEWLDPFFPLPLPRWMGPQPPRHHVLSQKAVSSILVLHQAEKARPPPALNRLMAFLPLHHSDPAGFLHLDCLLRKNYNQSCDI